MLMKAEGREEGRGEVREASLRSIFYEESPERKKTNKSKHEGARGDH